MPLFELEVIDLIFRLKFLFYLHGETKTNVLLITDVKCQLVLTVSKANSLNC